MDTIYNVYLHKSKIVKMGSIGKDQGSISTGLVSHVFGDGRRSGKSIRVRLMEQIGEASNSEKYPNDRYINNSIFRKVIDVLELNNGEPSIELVAQLLDVIEEQQEALSDLSDVLMRSKKGMKYFVNLENEGE